MPRHASAREPPASERKVVKGRGTVWAIEPRFSQQTSEPCDDGWGSLDQAAGEEHVAPGTRVIEESVKSILSSNTSPDIHFDLSINPYRGCEHEMWNSLRELGPRNLAPK